VRDLCDEVRLPSEKSFWLVRPYQQGSELLDSYLHSVACLAVAFGYNSPLGSWLDWDEGADWQLALLAYFRLAVLPLRSQELAFCLELNFAFALPKFQYHQLASSLHQEELVVELARPSIFLG